jgi:glycosyltransferase involved in cell wall biosynthesis
MHAAVSKLLHRRGLVRRDRIWRLRLRSALSSRIRVGFGPITTGEADLGLRHWHIDPIVDAINRAGSRYVADVFLRRDELTRFDVVVVVKQLQAVAARVRRLRPEARCIFDPADLRTLDTANGSVDLFADPGAFERHYLPLLTGVDGLVLSSPLQHGDFAGLDVPKLEIPRPVRNRRHRTQYAHAGPIRLVWQGYRENLAPMQRLRPILEALRAETGLDLQLVVDTNLPPRVEGLVHYTEWSVRRWERVLAEADLGVVIKPEDDPYQQRKSTTKLVSYMAAGLPVVCTPSAADRGVITHGETGFFASDDREWRDCLRALVTDAGLRERIGRAARRHALDVYPVERIAGEYLRLFDDVLAAPPHRRDRLA